MRTRSVMLILLLTLLVLPDRLQAQNEQNALKYMNDIFSAVENSKNETWAYLKAVTRGKGARVVENKRQDLLTEIRNAKFAVQRVRQMTPDDSLKSIVLNYLTLSYTVLKEDFDKILDMEEIAEQSYDLMEAYLLAKEQANDKLNEAFDEMVAAQKAFAARYSITLLDGDSDKTTERIQNAGEILKYYNDLYLIFFKSYKQEAYVLDAMVRNDLIAFEQNTATLLSYSSEGLDLSDTIRGFRGDTQLKYQLQKTLRFYKQEAEKDFPHTTDFYMKKDSYEKTLKKFETINPRSRTQQDVNTYNETVTSYNQAVKDSNAALEANNNERNKILKEWNKAVEAFFNRYSN